jgi:hypothetical protein
MSKEKVIPLKQEANAEAVSPETEEKKFQIVIEISNQNLAYKSDFSEPETIFWIEAVKQIILKKTFEDAGIQS